MTLSGATVLRREFRIDVRLGVDLEISRHDRWMPIGAPIR